MEPPPTALGPMLSANAPALPLPRQNAATFRVLQRRFGIFDPVLETPPSTADSAEVEVIDTTDDLLPKVPALPHSTTPFDPPTHSAKSCPQ